MLRYLLIKARFDLSSRTWENELSTALKLFWLGDFEAANRGFEHLMQKTTRFLTDIERRPKRSWEKQFIQEMRRRVLHTTNMVTAGRWATAYLSGRTNAVYPPIPDVTRFSDAAWQFVVNVHLSLCNTAPEALRLYTRAVRTWHEPRLENKISKLVLSLPRSLEAIDVLRALFGKMPDDEQVAHRFCHWLLEEGWLTEFYTTADIYLASVPNDPVILDMLAYVAERSQDWPKAQFLYAKAQNYERAAFMAFLNEDQISTAENLRAISAVDRQSPICNLCQGWLAFVQHKYNTAIDIWVHVAAPNISLESEIGVLFALRSWNQDPIRCAVEIENKARDRLPDGVQTIVTWLAGQMHRRNKPRTENEVEERWLTDTVLAAEGRLKPLFDIYAPNQKDLIIPFLQTIAPVFALVQFRKQCEDLQYLWRWLPRSMRCEFDALHLARKGERLEALSMLPIREEISPLQRHLGQLILGELLRERDWASLSLLLQQWKLLIAEIADITAIEDLVLVEMWQEGNYEELATELIRRLKPEHQGKVIVPNYSTELTDQDYALLRLHHCAALVLSKIAVRQGQSNTWRQAMSHWAVILSDNRYWYRWYQTRQPLYGGDAYLFDPSQLPELIALAIARQSTVAYDADNTEDDDINGIPWLSEVEQSIFNQALLAWEWECVIALRHVLMKVSEQGVTVSEWVCRLLSPTLLKEHAPEAQRDLLNLLVSVKPDGDAVGILKSAFSPDADILLLLDAGQSEIALKIGKVSRDRRGRLNPLLRGAYEQIIHEQLRNKLYAEAFETARSALCEFSQDRVIQDLFCQTAIRWADPILASGNFDDVMLQLSTVQEKTQLKLPQLDQVFALAYVRHGKQLLHENDNEAALDALLSAVHYDKHNDVANELVAVIFHNLAVSAFEEGQIDVALRYVQRSLTYADSSDTIVLLVELNTHLAQSAALEGQWGKVERSIEVVLQYGELVEVPTVFTSCIAMLTGVLLDANRLSQAIKMLESAVRMPYDGEVMDIAETLAALLTTEGESYAKRGQSELAERMWRLALVYDPTNTRAESYVSRLEATQWRKNL